MTTGTGVFIPAYARKGSGRGASQHGPTRSDRNSEQTSRRPTCSRSCPAGDNSQPLQALPPSTGLPSTPFSSGVGIHDEPYMEVPCPDMCVLDAGIQAQCSNGASCTLTPILTSSLPAYPADDTYPSPIYTSSSSSAWDLLSDVIGAPMLQCANSLEYNPQQQLVNRPLALDTARTSSSDIGSLLLLQQQDAELEYHPQQQLVKAPLAFGAAGMTSNDISSLLLLQQKEAELDSTILQLLEMKQQLAANKSLSEPLPAVPAVHVGPFAGQQNWQQLGAVQQQVLTNGAVASPICCGPAMVPNYSLGATAAPPSMCPAAPGVVSAPLPQLQQQDTDAELQVLLQAELLQLLSLV